MNNDSLQSYQAVGSLPIPVFHAPSDLMQHYNAAVGYINFLTLENDDLRKKFEAVTVDLQNETEMSRGLNNRILVQAESIQRLQNFVKELQDEDIQLQKIKELQDVVLKNQITIKNMQLDSDSKDIIIKNIKEESERRRCDLSNLSEQLKKLQNDNCEWRAISEIVGEPSGSNQNNNKSNNTKHLDTTTICSLIAAGLIIKYGIAETLLATAGLALSPLIIVPIIIAGVIKYSVYALVAQTAILIGFISLPLLATFSAFTIAATAGGIVPIFLLCAFLRSVGFLP